MIILVVRVRPNPLHWIKIRTIEIKAEWVDSLVLDIKLLNGSLTDKTTDNNAVRCRYVVGRAYYNLKLSFVAASGK